MAEAVSLIRGETPRPKVLGAPARTAGCGPDAPITSRRHARAHCRCLASQRAARYSRRQKGAGAHGAPPRIVEGPSTAKAPPIPASPGDSGAAGVPVGDWGIGKHGVVPAPRPSCVAAVAYGTLAESCAKIPQGCFAHADAVFCTPGRRYPHRAPDAVLLSLLLPQCHPLPLRPCGLRHGPAALCGGALLLGGGILFAIWAFARPGGPWGSGGSSWPKAHGHAPSFCSAICSVSPAALWPCPRQEAR